MNSKDIAVMAVFCTAILGMLLRPVMMAWARRLSSGASSADISADVEELRHRLLELEAERGHMQELEERLDFAERMLAQRSDAAPLPLNRTPV